MWEWERRREMHRERLGIKCERGSAICTSREKKGLRHEERCIKGLDIQRIVFDIPPVLHYSLFLY